MSACQLDDPGFIATVLHCLNESGLAPEQLVLDLLSTVVQLTARLGLRSVAEGVEHSDQEQFLRIVGAHAVQGNEYLRPSSADQLTIWLAENLDSGDAETSAANLEPTDLVA